MNIKKSSRNISGSNGASINSASLKEIIVTYGKAEGINAITSFDKALWDAGIANYNLIKVTSIIPKESKIIVRKADRNRIEVGNKLYVVLSEHRESKAGWEAWAGLG